MNIRRFAAAVMSCAFAMFAWSAEVDFTAQPVQEARALIQSGKAECVLVVNGQVLSPKSGRGVNPLLDLYEKTPQQMAGAIVVDKVIGRAAAAIAISGKARAVYGELMSEDGAEFLRRHGIAVAYTKMVPRILNQNRDGLCPLEQSVLGIDNPAKAVAALKVRIAELQAAGRRK